MKYLILILIFFMSTLVNAQEDYSFNALYRSFAEGSTQYILNNNTVIFTVPSAASNSSDSLSIGHAIQILERMDELEVRKGFRTNWYHIQYETSGKISEGFVWGGHIAVGHTQSKRDSSIRFLYGVAQIKLVDRGDYQDPSLFIQIQAARNGIVLDNIEIEAAGTIYTKTQLLALGNKGLRGISDILELSYSDGYCGGVSATSVLFWTGTKIHFIRLLSNGFSDKAFTNQLLIYPRDEGGQSQMVIYRKERGVFENKQQLITQRDDLSYIWNGQTLILL